MSRYLRAVSLTIALCFESACVQSSSYSVTNGSPYPVINIDVTAVTAIPANDTALAAVIPAGGPANGWDLLSLSNRKGSIISIKANIAKTNYVSMSFSNYGFFGSITFDSNLQATIGSSQVLPLPGTTPKVNWSASGIANGKFGVCSCLLPGSANTSMPAATLRNLVVPLFLDFSYLFPAVFSSGSTSVFMQTFPVGNYDLLCYSDLDATSSLTSGDRAQLVSNVYLGNGTIQNISGSYVVP